MALKEKMTKYMARGHDAGHRDVSVTGLMREHEDQGGMHFSSMPQKLQYRSVVSLRKEIVSTHCSQEDMSWQPERTSHWPVTWLHWTEG